MIDPDPVQNHEDDAKSLKALEHMSLALSLLDDSGASPDIGCHLDFAIHRLSKSLDLAIDPAIEALVLLDSEASSLAERVPSADARH